MSTSLVGIAELDLGEKASKTVTAAFYRELLDQLLLVADFVALFQKEPTTPDLIPSEWKRVETGCGLPPATLAKIRKYAQAGYRMAILLSSGDKALHLLEARGYKRCESFSPGSEPVVRGWESWLELHAPDSPAALVFGHDFEPAFVFERIER